MYFAVWQEKFQNVGLPVDSGHRPACCWRTYLTAHMWWFRGFTKWTCVTNPNKRLHQPIWVGVVLLPAGADGTLSGPQLKRLAFLVVWKILCFRCFLYGSAILKYMYLHFALFCFLFFATFGGIWLRNQRANRFALLLFKHHQLKSCAAILRETKTNRAGQRKLHFTTNLFWSLPSELGMINRSWEQTLSRANPRCWQAHKEQRPWRMSCLPTQVLSVRPQPWRTPLH